MKEISFKRELFYSFLIFIIWGVLMGIGYVIIPPVITQMYEGNAPITWMNTVISGQEFHVLEHYIDVAYRRGNTWLSWTFALFAIILFYLFHGRNLISRKTSHVRFLSPFLLLGFLFFAISNQLIVDDAFISFRYADNMVNGHGLVYNPGGERVEGYSNFLWTILMTIPLGMGFDPAIPSQAMGLFCLVWALIATFKLADLIFESSKAATFVVIIVGTNYSFSAIATSGLETAFLTALIASFAWMIVRESKIKNWQVSNLLFISLLGTACVLTRLDSVLILSVFYVALFWTLWQETKISQKQKINCSVALLMPGVLICFIYGGWKLSYYDNLLPNTAYAKSPYLMSLSDGFIYVVEFYGTYGLIPFMVFFFARICNILKKHKLVYLLFFSVLIWTSYLVYIGGDFIEFRFFVMVLPFISILLISTFYNFMSYRYQLVLILGIIGMSFYHGYLFESKNGINSISDIRKIKVGKWEEIGMNLNKLFGCYSKDVVIATTAAGVIPFYSKLPTIDMHGINNSWIAKNALIKGKSDMPGHHGSPSLSELRSLGANLLVGDPFITKYNNYKSFKIKGNYLMLGADKVTIGDNIKSMSYEKIPKDAKIISISLSKGKEVHILYLGQNTTIDRILKEEDISYTKISS